MSRMTKITQVAINPITGVIHQRTGSRPYKFCVVTPSQWRRYSYVEAWTASEAPRVRPGDTVLPVRVVTDKLELAELAVVRAEGHFIEQLTTLTNAIARTPDEYQTQEMRDRWIIELRRRMTVAKESLAAARAKLDRLQSSSSTTK